MDFDIQQLAKLAKLHIPDEEAELFTRELVDTLKVADSLPALEGDVVVPDTAMMLRKDVVVPSFSHEDILKNAPRKAQGCFVVPQTVE